MLAWVILSVVLVVLLFVDLKLFARGRQPSFREGAIWSVGWLVLSVLAALVIWPIRGGGDATQYVTVYLVERSLSLDNLFVFLMLFAYFAIPEERRPRLLFWGIVAALVLRGAAILGGVALIESFHAVVYVLGVTLLVLAWRIWSHDDESADPERSAMVRAARRLLGRRGTPELVCLVAIVLADIAFAVDSIPAAFGITRDPFVIWMGNVFALLGLRALFVLVEGLAKRFRYLDETIAAVLGVVGVKLLIEDLVKLGPVASLAMVMAAFAVGLALSIRADRRDARYAKKKTSPSTA
ncbi:MAG: tellurite resistance protein TerC [Thermoleophilaceae bacterium]|jgi:tellurite resistance protein TerC|nr:tellurite resistance protein TerC [Thermoleophilaceae bacterium]